MNIFISFAFFAGILLSLLSVFCLLRNMREEDKKSLKRTASGYLVLALSFLGSDDD